MSYEGYEQCICKNGHYYERDAYDQDAVCHCGEPSAWDNGVDCTNGDQDGFIPTEALDKFLITPDVFENCNLGHPHLVKHAVYRIPTREETKPLCVYPSQVASAYKCTKCEVNFTWQSPEDGNGPVECPVCTLSDNVEHAE